jgi:hypothetical protein
MGGEARAEPMGTLVRRILSKRGGFTGREEDSQQEKRTPMHAACGDALMTRRRGAVRRLFARAVGVGAAACLEAEGQWAPYSKKLNLGCEFRTFGRQVNDAHSK